MTDQVTRADLLYQEYLAEQYARTGHPLTDEEAARLSERAAVQAEREERARRYWDRIEVRDIPAGASGVPSAELLFAAGPDIGPVTAVPVTHEELAGLIGTVTRYLWGKAVTVDVRVTAAGRQAVRDRGGK